MHYEAVQGSTLRDLTKDISDPRLLLESFGVFLAELHRKGIYFRSIHFGNVVLQETGEFGLIDIADLRFFGRPLSEYQRERNFKHLLRPKEDTWILQENLKFIYGAYNQHRNSLQQK